MTFYKEYKDQLEYINNKKYWGTDGEIPKTEYKSIEIYIGIKNSRPEIAIDNLFETSLYNTQVNHDKTNDVLYIQSMNSDGAGSYEVIWKIKKGVYKERYIAWVRLEYNYKKIRHFSTCGVQTTSGPWQSP